MTRTTLFSKPYRTSSPTSTNDENEFIVIGIKQNKDDENENTNE